jgi:hypothetical protein
VDLDGDGKVDVLSGSYSRHDPNMAGLFQVLQGQGNGRFGKAKELCGTDGKPLIIPATKEQMTDNICTRPWAVDLDGDGNLDLVVGNFSGTFAVFKGEGKGAFAPVPTWLTDTNGKKLQVDSHGDPFLIDWDGDGDLDLLSGSAQGGVFLFRNEGSAKEPKFGKKQTLVKATGYQQGGHWGDADLTGPQHATRVWVDDVDGDGKYDLLVGDAVTLTFPAEGLDEAKARTMLAAWEAEQKEALAAAGGDNKKVSDVYQAMQKKQEAIVREEMTGFVWLYRGK